MEKTRCEEKREQETNKREKEKGIGRKEKIKKK